MLYTKRAPTSKFDAISWSFGGKVRIRISKEREFITMQYKYRHERFFLAIYEGRIDVEG
jgi:hypothetical protein